MKERLLVLLLIVAMVATGAGQAYASEGCDSLGDQILNEAKIQPWIAESIRAKCKGTAEKVIEQCKNKCSSTYGSDILIKYGCTYGCGMFRDEMLHN